jgi:hypothetical protein
VRRRGRWRRARFDGASSSPGSAAPRALDDDQGIGAGQGEIEDPPREAAVNDPTFARDRIGESHAKGIRWPSSGLHPSFARLVTSSLAPH